MNTTIDVRIAVLNAARSKKWVRENPPGSNSGEAVNAILAACHCNPGQAWCVAFCFYCLKEVLGVQWMLPMIAGTETCYDLAVDKSALFTEPQIGAIFLLHSQEAGRRVHHAGFVSSRIGGDLWGTVEGNTSPDGSPNGVGVFARERKFDFRDRFFYWWN